MIDVDKVVPLMWELVERVGESAGYGRDYKDYEDCERGWQNLLLREGNPHEGDCTGLPMTCDQCLIKGERRDAWGLIEAAVRFYNTGNWDSP